MQRPFRGGSLISHSMPIADVMADLAQELLELRTYKASAEAMRAQVAI